MHFPLVMVTFFVTLNAEASKQAPGFFQSLLRNPGYQNWMMKGILESSGWLIIWGSAFLIYKLFNRKS